MRLDFEWNIDPDVIEEALGQKLDEVSEHFVGALYEEMETVKAKSQEIVPLRFGVLRASADAVGVNVRKFGSRGDIAIGYGGAASAYSILQHQTPPPEEAEEGQRAFRHAAGRTWKYLERPMLEAIPGLEGRLAARIRDRIDG